MLQLLSDSIYKINNHLLFIKSLSNTQRYRKVESKNMGGGGGGGVLQNTNQKKAGVAILVSFKVDSWAKRIPRDK